MIIKSYPFRKATIIGVGMIGGSVGLALRKHELAKEIIGCSHRQSSLNDAVRVKAIDRGYTDVPKAIKGSDLIVLAAPVESIIKLFKRINPYLKRGCVVTDVGSTKAEIVEAAEKYLSVPSQFVGSHPLAGSELKGVINAKAELFENSQCIMTPTKVTHRIVVDKVKHLWTKVGATIRTLDADKHDEFLAYTSHLPHVIAYGLMEAIPQSYLEYASQGLRDTTRIAASSPQMWNDIFLTNAKNVVKSLDDVIEQLAQLRKSIVNHDQRKLVQQCKNAKTKRDSI